ncbi:hypothetical protein I4N56_009820 [Pseudomonas mohnii]|uniref:hypothetical protein n=1 Tax=Pseudomonas mohnii TaxID=395600 RepID=UPI0018DB7026|nr:hypothetical protein [Pseudomonas mohnii]MBH8611209.1 hypothetical protein [Pseudomonas mohnii]
MQLNMQDIIGRLHFSYEGGTSNKSAEINLVSDLSALVANDIHDALRVEFKLAAPFLMIGHAVSFYSLSGQQKKNRHSSTFSDSFAYLAVIEIDGICHAIFIADVLTLADVIHRLGPLRIL